MSGTAGDGVGPEHAAGADTAQRQRHERQRRQAEADIADVEMQVVAGELDRATANQLIDRYRHEIAALSVALTTVSEPVPDHVSRRRRWAGALILVAAFVVAGVLAGQAIRPRQQGSFITGGSDTPAVVDLDTVTNDQIEAVIAANPNVPEVAQMRLALANRYFEEADFSSALNHYLEAMGGQLGSGQRAQALGRVGWMTYISGQADLAQQYVERSIATDGEYAEGTLFLALIELYGNGDPAAALPLLEELSARDDVPADIRGQIEAATADAQAALSGDS